MKCAGIYGKEFSKKRLAYKPMSKQNKRGFRVALESFCSGMSLPGTSDPTQDTVEAFEWNSCTSLLSRTPKL